MSNNMIRLLALQPFSRDHGLILLCANWCRKAVRVSKHDRLYLTEEIRTMCRDVVLFYLEDEQNILSPFISDPLLKSVFQRHHDSLRKAIFDLENACPGLDPGVGLMGILAAKFEIYVRWEENFLFPGLEQRLSYENVQRLAAMTGALEVQRRRPTQMLTVSVSLERPSGLPKIGVNNTSLSRRREIHQSSLTGSRTAVC